MLMRLLTRWAIGWVTRLLANYTVPHFVQPKVSARGVISSTELGPLENMSVRQLVFFFGAQLLNVLFHRLLARLSPTEAREQLNVGTNGLYRALNVASVLGLRAKHADQELMHRNSDLVAFVNSIATDKEL